MPSSPNTLDFDCDWRLGVNLSPQRKGTIGYLLFWSGCGGLNLSKDIEVWNPFSGQGQTVVSGKTVKCIGLIETFRFEGGAEDPIRISAYVSKATAANVRAKLSSPLPSTKAKVSWYIINYDDDAKVWHESALLKGTDKADVNLDTCQGRVQMFIDNTPTRISDTLDVKAYKFEFQIVPAFGATANLEFSTGASERLVKSWGGSG